MTENKIMMPEFHCTETGYDPFLISGGWQMAYLTCVDEHRLDDLVDMEVHKETDEAFVLVDGGGVLVVTEFNKDNSPVFVAKKMERNVTYNVPAGTWHNIAMDEDAKILIIEKALTHRNDVEHRPLDKEQRERLTRIIACTI